MYQGFLEQLTRHYKNGVNFQVFLERKKSIKAMQFRQYQLENNGLVVIEVETISFFILLLLAFGNLCG